VRKQPSRRLLKSRQCPNYPPKPALAKSNSSSSTSTESSLTASSSSSPPRPDRSQASSINEHKPNPRNPPAKGFHAHDGTSISLARLASIKTGLITKRISETVALRARDLKLEYVRQGIHDKRTAFEEVVKEAGIKPEEAAFVGDDVIDLPAMRAAGLAIAVRNARAEVKREAHYVTPLAGGEGALRDAVEFILKAQGKWKNILEAYIGERSPKPSSSP
jgi:3-deoxy-D-manno-octulosonate 8-phosphate phosphatase (KDO 8-P phosphatase)